MYGNDAREKLRGKKTEGKKSWAFYGERVAAANNGLTLGWRKWGDIVHSWTFSRENNLWQAE